MYIVFFSFLIACGFIFFSARIFYSRVMFIAFKILYDRREVHGRFCRPRMRPAGRLTGRALTGCRKSRGFAATDAISLFFLFFFVFRFSFFPDRMASPVPSTVHAAARAERVPDRKFSNPPPPTRDDFSFFPRNTAVKEMSTPAGSSEPCTGPTR